MANLPKPRSYNQILGDMISSFLSRYGLTALYPGSPLLAILEAAAQSDLRNGQDIFNVRLALSIDNATGDALDNIGNSENIKRQGSSTTTGSVTITDASFQKISSKIYQGLPAPIVGSTNINVSDGSSFPPSGKIYLGRGTLNYEGSLPYASIENNGSYWTITLTSPTQVYHNLGETVILAQGGDRVIQPQTVVQTPQGNASNSVQYSVTYQATIPDGEVSVSAVPVRALKAGTQGNIPANAIKSFVNAPFPGATVTNPLPFTNGLSRWDDETYRKAIKTHRKTRSKGTDLAILNAVQGLVATDENKRITSASILKEVTGTDKLYIDDGTGYEAASKSVAVETLTSLAVGGETLFQLQQAPLQKASVVTDLSAPFKLQDAMVLAVSTGTSLTEHVFSAATFRDIASATAEEICASINSDPTSGFGASTQDQGQRVRIWARSDDHDDLQVVTPTNGVDANNALGFSTERQYTLWLTKNDRALTKDGSLAQIKSLPFGNWKPFTGTQTIQIGVDGTPVVTYSIADSAFLDAKTPYAGVGNNSLLAWAAVLNKTLPGITCTVESDRLVLTSNLGATSDAAIEILGGTLCDNFVFPIQSVSGITSDYSLNPNTSQIQLAQPLVAGDRLSAGTNNSRVFADSASIDTLTIAPASPAKLYVLSDGNAEIVDIGEVAGLSLTISTVTSNPTESWGARVSYALDSSKTNFANVQAGDWIIAVDSALSASNVGYWRVAQSSDYEIQIERASLTTPESVTLEQSNGLVVVRSKSQVQEISISGTSLTSNTIAEQIQNQLADLRADTFHTTRVRIQANDFNDGFTIAAINTAAFPLGFSTGVYSPVGNPHPAFSQSTNACTGTPVFVVHRIQSVTDDYNFTTRSASDISTDSLLVFARNFDTVQSGSASYFGRYGSRAGSWTAIESLNGTTIQVRNGAEYLALDRFYVARPFAIGPSQNLVVTLDQDQEQHFYNVPLSFQLKSASNSYASTNTFETIRGQNLSAIFGDDYDFEDHSIYVPARAVSDSGDSTKALLWRYKRLGPDGVGVQIQFGYPSNAGQPLQVTTDITTDTAKINVTLPSGDAHSNLNPPQNLGVIAQADGNRQTLTYVTGFAVSNASRSSNIVTLTLTLPGSVAICGLASGDSIYLDSTDSNFPSGIKTIDAVSADGLTYEETAADATSTNIGTISKGTAKGTIPTDTVVGDIVSIGSDAPGSWRQTFKVTAVGPQFVEGVASSSLSGSTTVTWAPLTTAYAIQAYPLASNTASEISTAINALDQVAVTTTLLGDGSGVISSSSDDAAGNLTLTDGAFQVQSASLVSDQWSFVFKETVDPTLATGCDWQNETIQIVPRTAKAIQNWLAVQSLTGLDTGAETLCFNDARQLQIRTNTAGSAGAVQIQTGTGNGVIAPVLRQAWNLGTGLALEINAGTASGLNANEWIQIQGAAPFRRSVFTSDTKVMSIDTDGSVVIDSSTTPVWSYAGDTGGAFTGQIWRIEKQGGYVRFSHSVDQYGDLNLGSIKEGDLVRITSSSVTSPLATVIDGVNTGVYSIVRTDFTSDESCFWIQNPEAIESDAVIADIAFFTPDSLMVGDTLNISTNALNNKGVYTVISVGSTGGPDYADRYRFKLGGDVADLGSPVVLGNDANLIQVHGPVSTWTKRIAQVIPSPDDSTRAIIYCDSNVGYQQIGTGAQITAQDKLGFDTSIHVGTDAYRYNTGLIAEANKVLYGDPRDTATYPGVLAAGADLPILGSEILRVSFTLAIRIQTGISRNDIQTQVQSAVASVVNANPQGNSLAISDILGAARSVYGVRSVAVVSPAFGPDDDLIVVQPRQKTKILNLNDVSITFIGD